MGNKIDYPDCVAFTPVSVVHKIAQHTVNTIAPQGCTQKVQFRGAEPVRRVQDLAKGRHFQQPGDERGRPSPQVVHTQPAVEVDVVEGLGQIAGFALVGIAVQQHDRGVVGLPQEVKQVQRIGLVQIAVPVAEADVELQRLAQPQRLVQPETQQNPIVQPDTAAVTPPAAASATCAADGSVRSPSNPPR